MSRIERHWYAPSPWMSILLAPLESLFAVVGGLRRAAFRRGWLKSSHPGVPVVIIGNINVGGVGKTPLTLSLIESLRRMGIRAGVVSRGYGGAHREPTEVTAQTPASLVGDEPLLLAASQAPVVVGRDRVAAARWLLARHPDIDVILSDDGLQHYRLRRDLEIVVMDGRRGTGNGRLLPNGPLREPLSRLATVDALVINGPSEGLSGLPDCAERFAMRLAAGECYLAADPSICRGAASFAGQKVVALAGIGHPERFFATAREQGFVLARTIAFPDHHPFGPGDIPDDADAVLVTAKDAVKLRHLNHARLWVLPVRAVIEPDLAAWITTRLRLRHGR
ncbi:tetraacyldisaccharide 4'-kinase [Paludibacterium paludis]|uniref:Tetraacyldisaccharide 4'-kinase n=1 Tax=Paludibacterium paludis TaxID=1225769 RepID=A0A918NWH8_9NEIS|nr:tetraacyldisaccharide 4'-kinase [Paludibacterium paludis]GGY02476.1 tetraacyldisaccharide 4'-kinase [Paludibacterium paludis]